MLAMHELSFSGDDKPSKYAALLPQIEAVFAAETNWLPNLANCTAILKEAFGWFWVGFYLSKGGELVLGPFQGTLACTRIPFNKGVCGAAYTTKEIQLVPDVNAFPGHIACSATSQSEIVLPIFNQKGAVAMVLDVDSEHLNHFDAADSDGLAAICQLIEKYIVPAID